MVGGEGEGRATHLGVERAELDGLAPADRQTKNVSVPRNHRVEIAHLNGHERCLREGHEAPVCLLAQQHGHRRSNAFHVEAWSSLHLPVCASLSGTIDSRCGFETSSE
jgi:hypothetical protein